MKGDRTNRRAEIMANTGRRIVNRSGLRVRHWLGAAVVFLTAGCSEDEARAPQDTGTALRVEAVELSTTSVPVTLTAAGTTEPFARATLSTRLMGQVARVAVSEGDQISEGDLVVQIEDRDLAAKRRQAASGVEAAKAVLENAEAQTTRVRNLFAEKAIQRSKLDEAEMGLRQARAGLTAAQGVLAEVNANLRYSAVRSTMAGIVAATFVEAGDLAGPGAPLITVEQQDPMKVVVDVAGRDLSHIAIGGSVDVEIEIGQANTVFEGRVDAIVPSGDAQSRTFQVKVLIENTGDAVRSGMFARVRFPRGERPGLMIDARSIVREGQLEGVYLVQDGRALLRWIRLGRPVGDRIEVLSGLAPGDLVVRSVGDVRDGVRVRMGRDG